VPDEIEVWLDYLSPIKFFFTNFRPDYCEPRTTTVFMPDKLQYLTKSSMQARARLFKNSLNNLAQCSVIQVNEVCYKPI
jgi:hypothetical protein